MDAKTHYNKIYANENYFGYSERLYESYIEALIRKVGLPRGAAVLDAPCGQGFFSYLFHKQGMKVRGADISTVGIARAREAYASSDIEFLVADIRKLPFPGQFDCIYTRSCSLYNSPDFIANSDVTTHLLRLLKPGGIFIFAYNTNLRCSDPDPANCWINHSLTDVKHHFENFKKYDPRFYLINKVDTYFLGRLAFNGVIGRMNAYLLPALKRNGDALCVFRKTGKE